MFEYLPVTLIVCWMLFTGALHSNRAHIKKYYLDYNRTDGLHIFLVWFTTLGSITGTILFIILFTKVPWFYPIILIIVSFIFGAVFYGLLDSLFGRMSISFLSILIWPVTQFIAYRIIMAL